MPKGIPTIVIISTILPIKYSMAIIIPPNISQIRFPRMIHRMSGIELFKYNCFIFRIFNRIGEYYLFCFLWFYLKIPFYFTCLLIKLSS